MTKINETLKRAFEGQPDQTFQLIIRISHDSSSHLAWLESEGFMVKQQFRLSPGAALSCSGAKATKLLAQDWVISIDADGPVSGN